jgi:hypothetical protein
MKFSVYNHEPTRPLPDDDFIKRLQKEFSVVCNYFGRRDLDFAIHFYGTNYPSIGWTAGGRVALCFQPMDGSPRMDENAPMDFLRFLMFHEVSHNIWCPEGVIPIYVTSQLMAKHGISPKAPIQSVIGSFVDVVVNTHLMREPIEKKFPFTGKQLVAANFSSGITGWRLRKLDDKAECKRIYNSLSSFERWHIYFYYDEQEFTPPMTGRGLDLLRKMIRVGKPAFTWREEYYKDQIELFEIWEE